MILKTAPVAQLDRAADFESVGRVFEPPQARHLIRRISGDPAPGGISDSASLVVSNLVIMQ